MNSFRRILIDGFMSNKVVLDFSRMGKPTDNQFVVDEVSSVLK